MLEVCRGFQLADEGNNAWIPWTLGKPNRFFSGGKRTRQLLWSRGGFHDNRHAPTIPPGPSAQTQDYRDQ